MEFDEEEFRRRFPALYSEIKRRRMSVRVSGYRSNAELAEKEAETKLPGVIDYLRRCDTDDQGREVIEYLKKTGELGSEEAELLLRQLEEKGIRSFGTRKQLGHYFREAP